jgi:hypothetical protein
MTILQLHPNSRLRASKPNFNVRVSGQRLEVPTDLAAVLARRRISNAHQWLALLFTFPSSLADDLGWALGDVEAARERLVGQLAGKVDEGYLHPQRHRRRVATGAFSPDGRGGSEEAY